MTQVSHDQAAQRIAKLKKLIQEWNYHYFVQDKSIFSEAARDDLKKELIDLETSYPDLITSDSPSQRIGSILSGRLPKHAHLSRKWSLSDIFSWEELQDWEERLRRLLPQAKWNYFCELKIDGLNVSLHYEKGKLVRALTRGDGVMGEDITHTIKTLYGVPLELQESHDVEVSGEVYMPQKSFEKLNNKLEKQGEEVFANPRNAAAGSVRQLDPAIASTRDLAMFIYTLGKNNFPKPPPTQEKVLELLRKLGFSTSPHTHLAYTLEGVHKFYQHIEKIRAKLPFHIDGIVVKVNELDIQKQAGFTAKTPRAMAAYKFTAEEASTVIEGITIQIGRTGALTPVAELRAVDLAGSTVKRATLHNKREIERKDIRIGDTVIIHKAGDIIPEIIRVLPELRTGKEKSFRFPTTCPNCHSATIEENEGTIVRCTNKKCFAQHREQLIHAASKKAFDIDGMGPQVIDQLLERDLITDIADFFLLKDEDLATLPLFKEKKITKLLQAAEAAKHIKLSRFLYALGIRHIGEETARDIALFASQHVHKEVVQKYEEMFNHAGREPKVLHPLIIFLSIVKAEDLLSISGFGEETSKSFVAWWQEKDHQHLIEKLSHVGVRIEALDLYHAKKKTFFTDKTFVITGTLKNFGREQAKEEILNSGGIIQSAVSSKTNYLLCGEEPGSKLKKAQELGVIILSEKEFMKHLK